MEKLYEVDGKVDCRWRLEGWGALVLGDGQCYRGMAVRKRYRHTLYMRSDGHIQPIWS